MGILVIGVHKIPIIIKAIDHNIALAPKNICFIVQFKMVFFVL